MIISLIYMYIAIPTFIIVAVLFGIWIFSRRKKNTKGVLNPILLDNSSGRKYIFAHNLAFDYEAIHISIEKTLALILGQDRPLSRTLAQLQAIDKDPDEAVSLAHLPNKNSLHLALALSQMGEHTFIFSVSEALKLLLAMAEELRDAHPKLLESIQRSTSLLANLILCASKQQYYKICVLHPEFTQHMKEIRSEINAAELAAQDRKIYLEVVYIATLCLATWQSYSIEKLFAKSSEYILYQLTSDKQQYMFKLFLARAELYQDAESIQRIYFNNSIARSRSLIFNNLVKKHQLVKDFWVCRPSTSNNNKVLFMGEIARYYEKSLHDIVREWQEKYQIICVFEIFYVAQKALDYLVRAIEGLVFLHTQRQLHGNIKPSNIFVEGEGVYITDIRVIPYEIYNWSHPETSRWKKYNAPEISHNKPDITTATDIYALGETILEVVFPGNTKNCEELEEDFVGDHFAVTIVKFVASMLHKSPQKRPHIMKVEKFLKELLAMWEMNRFNQAIMDEVFEEEVSLQECFFEDRINRNREPGLISAKLRTLAHKKLPYFLLYMDKPILANVITELSSLNCYYTTSLHELNKVLGKYDFCGILALSPMHANRSAAIAINKFKDIYPDALTIYHGWDYRIEISGKKALACQADVLMLGGIDINAIIPFIMRALHLKESGQVPIPSIDWYEEYLKRHCSTPHLWESAEKLREAEEPESQYE